MNRYHAELRAEVRGDTLAGHAAVFGQLARLPGHWEQVARGAFDAALKDGPDVRALVNHDPNALLGRTRSGTLRLDVDDTGLAFEVDLPDTRAATDLRSLLERGDITGASFGFMPGTDEWTTAPDGRQLRTHTSIRSLYDVSAVTYPAYDGTSATLRSVVFPRASARSQLVRVRARLLPKGTS